MQVRYQAALRPEIVLLRQGKVQCGEAAGIITDSPVGWNPESAPVGADAQALSRRRSGMAHAVDAVRVEHVQHVFQFDDHLLDHLVVAGGLLGVGVAGELLTGAADGEALLVEQAADLADGEHVLALVVTAVAAPLYRFELGEFLLPVAQHVRFDVAQLADLTDGEVALAGDRRQFVVMTGFEHSLPPAVSVFARDGR